MRARKRFFWLDLIIIKVFSLILLWFVLVTFTPILKLAFLVILGEWELTCFRFFVLTEWLSRHHSFCNLWKWSESRTAKQIQTSLFKMNVYENHHLQKWLPMLHCMTNILCFKLFSAGIASKRCSNSNWLMAFWALEILVNTCVRLVGHSFFRTSISVCSFCSSKLFLWGGMTN